MKMNAAVFDFDGTLMDSMYVWDNVAVDYLLNRGIKPREGLREEFKTMSIYQAVCHYRDEYGIKDDASQITDEINRMVEKAYYRDVLPKAGVEDFLKRLYSGGIKMCVATATDSHLITAALKRCNLLEYFTDVLTCTQVAHGKDEPNIYFEALKALGSDISDTAVFEDAYFAASTAKKAGFFVVGVYDKYEKNKEELKRISDVYIESFERAGDILL